MPHPHHPKRSGKRGAFALVLSMTVMATLLLTVISLAAILSLEARVGRASTLRKRAQLNALAGARIALGELQRTLGPDQRVSATADILCDPDKTDPTQDDYYRGPAGIVLHPRWVGVWNAGAVSGEKTDGEAEVGSKNRLFQRAQNGGYLKDSRFIGGADWNADRTTANLAQVSPRLVTWLASGNEAMAPVATGFLSPFARIGPGEAVALIGAGTLPGGKAKGLLPAGESDSDRCGVMVRRVPFDAEKAPNEAGYAWCVSDEGVKARINLTDPLAGVMPNAGNAGNGGFSRLLLSRRNRFDFDKVVSPARGAKPIKNYLNFSTSEELEGLSGFSAPTITGNPDELREYYLHDVTFISAGVLSDVANGGLKKDVTAFLRETGDIADAPGLGDSGLAGNAPLLSHPSRSGISPRFALIKDWWQNAPGYADTAAAPRAPTTFEKPYTLNVDRHNAGISIQYTENIPDLARQTQAARAPVLAEFSLHPMSFFDNSAGGTTGQLRALYYVKIELWNPYSTPLRLKNLSLTCRNWWSWEPQLPWGGTQYRSALPYVRYHFPMNLTIQPGESVLFVPDRQKCVATDPPLGQNENAAKAFRPRDVFMKESTPSNARDGYYIASMISPSSPWETAAAYPASERRYFRATAPYSPAGNGAWIAGSYDDATASVTQFFLSDSDSTPSGLSAGNILLGFLNFDSYFGSPSGDWPVGGISNSGFPTPAKYTSYSISPNPAGYIDNNNNPRAKISYKLRQLNPTDLDLKRGGSRIVGLGDPSKNAATDPIVEVNPVLDTNLRSPLQERHPFDGALRPWGGNSYVNTGAYGSYINPYDEGLTQSPASPRDYHPFLSARDAATHNATHAILFDTPFKEIGLYSLAQLRHAPFNALPFGTSSPFASGRIPVASLAGKTWVDRTGFSNEDLAQAWRDASQWANRDTQVRQLDRLQSATTGNVPPHDLFDLAFELNHALWDTFWLSGIPSTNTGLKSASARWETLAPSGGSNPFAHGLPDSRLNPTGKYPQEAGYFTSDNYRLYKPAHTLLLRGAFNVNSTSKVAWLSLLAASRELTVPNTDGKSTASGETPFPRVLHPESGPLKTSAASAFVRETWSGYRVLDDDELDRLADKIVAEVKRRGPFLSLADFVNRRLNPKSDSGNWNQDELNHLGTLESAIRAAGLNKPFSLLPEKDDMDRENRDQNTLSTLAVRQPQFRSPIRAGGAPGILEQGDLLQTIGSTLTARSDTFVIRARGDCEGAVAYLELTVQRMPEPIIPGDGAGTLPVNPKCVTQDVSAEFAGNQLFGRRMKVVAIRHLDEKEI